MNPAPAVPGKNSSSVMANSTELLPVDGVRLAACSAGIYAAPRDDLALFEICDGSRVSAVFTRNQFYAAPVAVARKHLQHGAIKYLLVNAGNANAGTGAKGIDDAVRICENLASRAGCKPESVLPFSTGLIGEYLPVDKICRALPGLYDNLSQDAWLDCARAIMTTDTQPKGCSVRFTTDTGLITVTGMAKGAGMINPDMATMLAFIATDAAVEQRALGRLLKSAVDESFNRICIDGDTSTNDACVLVATGKHDADRIIGASGPAYDLLREQITQVCVRLAQAIVRDGEGATKFVTIRVENARSEAECAEIANTISTSPLVKTALYASDPNWGRILAAVGRCNTGPLDFDRVSLYLNGACIFENGARAKEYTEEQGIAAMQDNDIEIRIDLNKGSVSGCYWTCDLSHDYVTINAEYRT